MNDRDPYLVKSVVHASQLLGAFNVLAETLTLKELAARSGLPKTMAFRLLYTLEKCGIVDKIGKSLYQSRLRSWKQKPYRLGYAASGSDCQFSKEVSSSLQREATNEGIELISLDNRYNAKAALRNADLLVREKVDLAIEFQVNETVAPIVAAKYREAKIPLIAIDIPHPGATYYGANNFEAGQITGRYFGRWVKKHWNGEADEIILLELNRAGELPRMRLTGMQLGLACVLPAMKNCRIVHLDGDGEVGPSFEIVRHHLITSRCRRALVSAINDPSALGALRAFQEAGRTECCAIMGSNATLEGRAAMREPNSRFLGSVAFFPERYGRDLIRVSIDILNQRPVPPALFVEHKLITPATVDQYYPIDSLTHVA